MAFQPPCAVGHHLVSAVTFPASCARPNLCARRNGAACPTISRHAYASASPQDDPITTATSETSSSSSAPSNDDEPTPPPNTFFQAISQAQASADAAIAASHTLLEVEFPPLPTSQLESAAVGADEVTEANLRLATDFAQRYIDSGQNVVLSFPDRIERDRASERLTPRDGLRFSCLRDSRAGWLIERLWTQPSMESAVQEDDDMFIVLGASCQELPDVECLVKDAGSRPVILFNLKLDSARGDLGLPAFPRRDLHFRFLSRVLPVYYLRTRTYSRSITKPPYVVNYSGALFRTFPGPYQVLLDTAGGNYRRLQTLEERPALGEVRDILTEGMNLDGGRKGKAGEQKSFLFRGYKSMTWWEEDRTKEESTLWRS